MSEPLQVVLVHPRIPPNAGNVARLCAATKSRLHLIRPLGFRVDDRSLRRAGLDYWDYLDLTVHENWEAFAQGVGGARSWLFSKTAERVYSEAEFRPGDYLVFGSETTGLPAPLLAEHAERTLRIPMLEPGVRSLNLADSVAIALYEALRQNGFMPETVEQNRG